MRKLLVFIALTSLVSFSSLGQTDKEYEKTLKKMFKVSGSEETYATAIDQMFVMFKESYTDVKPELWDELQKEFAKTSIDDLTEMLIPVYKKYLTVADLEAIIAFYASPAGKKYAKNTPFIMQESMQVGQEWGMKIGTKFAEKMTEKGY